MTDRELMQMALDALEEIHPDNMTTIAEKSWSKAIEALRAVLAQLEPEPVSMDSDKVICPSCCHQFRAIPVNVQQLMIDAGFRPPFTAPPQREWQGLTNEEIEALRHVIDWTAHWSYGNFARAVEAKLKEKNT